MLIEMRIALYGLQFISEPLATGGGLSLDVYQQMADGDELSSPFCHRLCDGLLNCQLGALKDVVCIAHLEAIPAMLLPHIFRLYWAAAPVSVKLLALCPHLIADHMGVAIWQCQAQPDDQHVILLQTSHMALGSIQGCQGILGSITDTILCGTHLEGLCSMSLGLCGLHESSPLKAYNACGETSQRPLLKVGH